MKHQLEVIAEIAQGFEGSYQLTNNIIKSAINSGVKSIKFQMVFADELATKNYLHYKLFKKLEMSFKEWNNISNYTSKNNIKLYFDIFGQKSLKFCERLKVEGVKIHPTDCLNYSLLKKVAQSKIKKIILGIGGYHLSKINKAIQILSNKDLVIMLGFQSYPTFVKSNNLKNIKITSLQFNNRKISIGFADHEAEGLIKSQLLSTLALGAGATVIEKHFTISKSLKHEDNESALEANEFSHFIKTLNEVYLGYSENSEIDKYSISNQEKNYLKVIKRNVVANKNIKKNSLIKISDLTLKRTGDKDIIYSLQDCIGKICRQDIKKNNSLKKKYLR